MLATGCRVGLLAALVASAMGCDRLEISPGVMRPGWRLRGPEETRPVTDWSFAEGLRELELETRAPWGWHSVRLWFAVADGRLYVAVYQKGASLLWARLLQRNPRARVRLEGRLYPVVATPVRDPDRWRAALEAMGRKYGQKLNPYDYPHADDTSVGRVFELSSEAP